MQPVFPSSVVFGNAQAEAVYCLITVIFFTVIAGLVFVFLTRETGLRNDLNAVLGRKLDIFSKGKALVMILPLWLLASGWFYNSTLGDKFYELQRRSENKAILWDLVYEYPHRVRSIPDEQVAKWTGQVGWERRAFRHALFLELKDGRYLRSAGLLPEEFESKAAILTNWGIKVLPDRKPQPSDGKPPLPASGK